MRQKGLLVSRSKPAGQMRAQMRGFGNWMKFIYGFLNAQQQRQLAEAAVREKAAQERSAGSLHDKLYGQGRGLGAWWGSARDRIKQGFQNLRKGQR
jgi:hypothetical protein